MLRAASGSCEFEEGRACLPARNDVSMAHLQGALAMPTHELYARRITPPRKRLLRVSGALAARRILTSSHNSGIGEAWPWLGNKHRKG